MKKLRSREKIHRKRERKNIEGKKVHESEVSRSYFDSVLVHRWCTHPSTSGTFTFRRPDIFSSFFSLFTFLSPRVVLGFRSFLTEARQSRFCDGSDRDRDEEFTKFAGER
jgi:hypothetical protein